MITVDFSFLNKIVTIAKETCQLQFFCFAHFDDVHQLRGGGVVGLLRKNKIKIYHF
jgi:hypothetical protein